MNADDWTVPLCVDVSLFTSVSVKKADDEKFLIIPFLDACLAFVLLTPAAPVVVAGLVISSNNVVVYKYSAFISHPRT